MDDEKIAEYSDSTGIFNRQLFKVAITQNKEKCHSKWDIINIHKEISQLRHKIDERRKTSEEKKPSENKDSGNTPPPVTTKVENEMLKQVDRPHEIIKYVTTLMVCYDSGGQPEFFDILPALATNPTGYIMVFDMSEDLNKRKECEVVIKGKKYLSESKISSMEMMKGAIAGIQSHCKSDCLLMVGTHLKEYLATGQKLEDIDKNQIYENVVKGNAHSIVRRRQTGKNSRFIHPIDNTNKSDERDWIAQEIRSAVEDMSTNENEHAEIPINWHLFQLEIQLGIEDTPKRNYITRKTCNEFAKKCYIEESKIDGILEYFHSLGIILYYKNVVQECDVVFSPQWIFNRLSDIIFLKYLKNCEYDDQDNIEKGIIEKIVLEKIYKEEIDADGPLKVEHLLEIFVTQNIIAKFPDREFQSTKYFMPVLRNPAPFDIKDDIITTKKYGNKIYERLYVKFDQKYFPRSVFCCLATHFMEKGFNILDDDPYSNMMFFQAPHKEYALHKYYVGLFDNKTEIFIEVYQKEGKDAPVTEISRLIYEFLIKFCKKIQFNSSLKFGFMCKNMDCRLIACVNLQFPYSTEKYCEKCKTSDLHCDEMVWLLSLQQVVHICKPQVRTYVHYVAS